MSEIGRSIGLTEASQLAELNPHMTMRLLQTLVQEGWAVEEETGPKYRLTLKPFQITSRPLMRSDLLRVAAEPIRKLHEQTGESTNFGILDDDRILIILHLNGTRPVTMIAQVGYRYPLHCVAPGKVLLAYAGEELVNRLVKEGVETFTPRSKTTKKAVMEDCAKTLAQGYALDEEEYVKGLACFASPIYNHIGSVIAALNISVLLLHYTMEEFVKQIGPKVLETARQISADLGYMPEKST